MGELIESDQEMYNPDDEGDNEIAHLIGSLQGRLQNAVNNKEAERENADSLNKR